MNDDITRLILLGIAGVILPAGYLTVCVWLRRRQTWWFAYLAYFVLFGTFGGWAFAFAMSPSGLTAASIIFLITVALGACVGSSLVLTFRRKKSRAEWVAMIGGYCYPGLVAAYFGCALLIFRDTP